MHPIALGFLYNHGTEQYPENYFSMPDEHFFLGALISGLKEDCIYEFIYGLYILYYSIIFTGESD